MYWFLKIHKNPVGFRFIIASKNCRTKPVTQVVSKIFKMISVLEISIIKWVVQNSFPVTEKLNKINDKP